jgi:hypothetical protein
MSGGGSQNQQSNQTGTSTNSLPSWLTGAFQGALGNSSNLYNSELGATSGQSTANLGAGLSDIAGVNPTSIGAANGALTNILGGGANGNATSAYNASNPLLTQEASGSLLSQQNPYLGAEYTQGLQGIQNNVDSQFGAAGRNVLAGAPVQADQAGTLATDLYGGAYNTNLNATQNAQGLVSGNYNTGIGAINNAAATSPGVTSGQYTQGTNLLNSGSTANNVSSWYQNLLGQSAAPFGQQATTGTNTLAGQSTLGPLQTASGILSLI